MQSEELVIEWMNFADIDYKTAVHLDENMYLKPLEIICYHCQQAIEKMLKGALVGDGMKVQKTHDFGLLTEQLMLGQMDKL